MNIKTLIAVCLITVAGISLVGAETVSVADVKALTKAGISEEIILSQIRSSHALFQLSTEEILGLKDAGVSQKVIDYMINTMSAVTPETPTPPAPAPTPVKDAPAAAPTPAPASSQTVIVATTPPPPAPVQIQEVSVGTQAPRLLVETIPPAPDPYFVWVSGTWIWRHTRLGFGYWEWVPGYWTRPPYRGAVWIGGGWGHRGWRDDHWH